MHTKGYGFLRNSARNFVPQPADPYVGDPLIRKHGLREGLMLSGPSSRPQGQWARLARVDSIEGKPPEAYSRRKFDELTPIDPHEFIKLETGKEPLTTRVMDMLTPIGKAARPDRRPPRTGKTVCCSTSPRP